jgi:hypothetical protein
MKTIGTCKECKKWQDCSKTNPEIYNTDDWGSCLESRHNPSLGKTTHADFGCIHWEAKSFKDFSGSLEEFMAKQRELQSPTPPKEPDEKWIAWEGDFPAMGAQLLPDWFVIACVCESNRKPQKRVQIKRYPLIASSSNYPTRTAQDLEIADLKRENNAVFERIQELSAELVRLGFDPTAKRKPVNGQCQCGNPSQHITGWNSDQCCDCGGIIPRQ